MVSFHPKIPSTFYYLLSYPKGKVDQEDNIDVIIKIPSFLIRGLEFMSLKMKRNWVENVSLSKKIIIL